MKTRQSYDNYLHCEKQCNGLKEPSWYLTQGPNGKTIHAPAYITQFTLMDIADPQILKYAANILYRGCDRYRCGGPIDKLLKGLKKDIFLMQMRFRDNSRRTRCGFKTKGLRQLFFGEENVRIIFKMLLFSIHFNIEAPKTNHF